MRKFQSDFRESNSKLHDLYLGWALELLQIVNPVIDDLFARGNLNYSEFAHAMYKVRRDLIMSDAAFFEAAALLQAGDDNEIARLITAANSPN